jgi:hypothetical protein
MHPVLAKLDARRRRALLTNELFAKLDETAQRRLLDCVTEIREELPHKDALDKLRPQREREIAALKSALAIILERLSNHDLVDEINGYLAADSDCDHIDSNVIETLVNAVGPVAEIMKRFGYAEDDGRQQRTRLPRWEALNLQDLLSVFGIEISRRTPDGCANPGLELIGLLADPPVSDHVILYRLRR